MGRNSYFNPSKFTIEVISTIYNISTQKTNVPVTVEKILQAISPMKNRKQLLRMRKKLNRALNKLKKDNIIDIKEDNRSHTISMTEEGNKFLHFIKIKEKKKNKKIKNGKRIVLFDIPEKMKKIRNLFRHFLKIIGYKELQKSVFISDYQNSNDLRVIVKTLGIERFVITGIFYENTRTLNR